jgi:hypothetical protein
VNFKRKWLYHPSSFKCAIDKDVMSLHGASQLTLWGFGAVYVGIMGMLVAMNAPAASPFWKSLVLALGAVAFAGLVATLTGRFIKVDDERR